MYSIVAHLVRNYLIKQDALLSYTNSKGIMEDVLRLLKSHLLSSFEYIIDNSKFHQKYYDINENI